MSARLRELGATWDGHGVDFAVFSEHATGVELCLFDESDALVERERSALTERTDLVWHSAPLQHKSRRRR